MSNDESSNWWTGSKSWLRELPNRSLAICLAVAFFASIVLTFKVPIVYQLLAIHDLHLQDQYFSWRDAILGQSVSGFKRDSDLILISVDNDSARRLGMPLPWPRQMYALLVRRLRDAGAKVIAFDLLFDSKSPANNTGRAELSSRLKSQLQPEEAKNWLDSPEGDDLAFARELRRARDVVLANHVDVSFNLVNGRGQFAYHLPYQLFVLALGSEDGTSGNVDVEPDDDGVVRKASLVFDNFRLLPSFYRSFGLRVSERFRQQAAKVDGERTLTFGKAQLPHSARINYLGAAGTINSIEFWRAFDWDKHFSSNPFAGKIVLIGYQDTPDTSDDAGAEQSAVQRPSALPANSFLTPTAGFSRPMSGVELQANIVANILGNSFLREPELWEQISLVFLAALLAARLLERLRGRPWSMLGGMVLLSVFWLVGSFACFCLFECVVPVLVPIFGVALPAWFLVLTDQNLFFTRERKKHTKVFKYLAPKELAQEIDRRRLDELKLDGKTALVTTFCCQLQDFVLLTEHKTPEAAIGMLNDCIAQMITAVYEHNGLVTRISNYGVMAVWGAPLSMPEESQCRLAASCYLDIQQKLAGLSQSWQREGRINSSQALVCLFGVSTGEAACGRIGSESHTEYSIVSRSVDLAVLLETLNRTYGTKCLTSERTAQRLTEYYEIRELDKLKTIRNDKPQYIYELQCQKGKLPGTMDEAVALYKQGLAALEERNFQEAERLFSTILLRLTPDDRPAAIMLERCRQYLRKPPEPDWDGAILVADII